MMRPSNARASIMETMTDNLPTPEEIGNAERIAPSVQARIGQKGSQEQRKALSAYTAHHRKVGRAA